MSNVSIPTLRDHVQALALAKALEPYRARTVRAISAYGGRFVSGRHAFHVREILSLCGGIASMQATEIMPPLDLDSVTCIPCLIALADRVAS